MNIFYTFVAAAFLVLAPAQSWAELGPWEGMVPANTFPAPINSADKVLLDVPHIRQKPWHCVPTSSAMVLQYFGLNHTPTHLKMLAERGKPKSKQNTKFTLWNDMKKGLRSIDQKWHINNFAKTDSGFQKGFRAIKRSLRKDQPVLIDVHLAGGHTFVVVGYDDQARVVYIKDPDLPSDHGRALSYDSLRKNWHNHRFAKNRSAFFSVKPRRQPTQVKRAGKPKFATMSLRGSLN